MQTIKTSDKDLSDYLKDAKSLSYVELAKSENINYSTFLSNNMHSNTSILDKFYKFEIFNTLVGMKPDYDDPANYHFPRLVNNKSTYKTFSIDNLENAIIFLFRVSLSGKYLELLRKTFNSNRKIHQNVISSVTLFELASANLLKYKNLSQDHRELITNINTECKKIINLNQGIRCSDTLNILRVQEIDVGKETLKAPELQSMENPEDTDTTAGSFDENEIIPENVSKFIDFSIDFFEDYNPIKINVNNSWLTFVVILLNFFTLGLINCFGKEEDYEQTLTNTKGM